MKDKQYQLKCGQCPFYTGLECHGHGDFWGECDLLNQFHKYIKNCLPKDVFSGASMSTICFDDTNCHLQDKKLINLYDYRGTDDDK